jgi:glycerol kinase
VAVLRTDGGMVENDPLMQFQAEILDRVMVRPALKETTALGAGLRGRPGNRLFQSAGDLQSRWPAGRTWKPKHGRPAARARVRLLEESGDALLRLGSIPNKDPNKRTQWTKVFSVSSWEPCC